MIYYDDSRSDVKIWWIEVSTNNFLWVRTELNDYEHGFTRDIEGRLERIATKATIRNLRQLIKAII